MFIACAKSGVRALSLPELLVALAVFMSAMVALVLVEKNCSRAAARSLTGSDSYRAAMLALTQCEHELRGARFCNDLADEIDGRPGIYAEVPYRLHDHTPDGSLRLNGLGNPDWSVVHLLKVENQCLTTDRVPHPWARLGEQGWIEFTFPEEEETHLLQVTVHAELIRGQTYEARQLIYLDAMN
ncbi:MAG: hypothetical protein U0931_36015 [Vulcanimicrobiota bacterium]